MTTTATLEQYYRNILMRDPSAAEVAGWMAAISDQQLTDAQVLSAIVNSTEAQTYGAQVIRFYQGAFDRVPDVTGMNGWVDDIQSGARTTTELALGFVNSAEWTARFGGTALNEAVLTGLYQNILGRTPAASEINAWIATGLSTAEVLIGFVNSAEFQANIATRTSELLTSAGNTATEDLAIVFSGTHCLCVAPGPQTYVLTTAEDQLRGSSESDTFIATLNTAEPTLQAADQIDGAGGAGDTLTATINGVLTADQTHIGGTMANVEIVSISNEETSGFVDTLDTSSWSGVETIRFSSSSDNGDTVVSNIAAIVAAEIAGGSGDLSLNYASAAVSGAADAQTLLVTDVAGGAFSAAGMEVLAITSSGSANTLALAPDDDWTSMTIAGDADLTLVAETTSLTSIDGSALNGNLALTAGGGTARVIVAGQGADTLRGGTAADTLTGNGGADVFQVFGAGGVADTITDMEFGSGATTVDRLDVSALGLDFSEGFDLKVTSGSAFSADEDIVVFASQSFADLAALDTAYEQRSTVSNAGGSDVLVLWQDAAGQVYLSAGAGSAGADAGIDGDDEYAFADLAELDGLTAAGIADLVAPGDFLAG